MTKLNHLKGLAICSTLLAAATSVSAQQAEDTTQPATPSAGLAGQDASAAVPMGNQSDPTPIMIRQGDSVLVTNGPVPDTKANRARFGQPDSHAGKKTAPAGN